VFSAERLHEFCDKHQTVSLSSATAMLGPKLYEYLSELSRTLTLKMPVWCLPVDLLSLWSVVLSMLNV